MKIATILKDRLLKKKALRNAKTEEYIEELNHLNKEYPRKNLFWGRTPIAFYSDGKTSTYNRSEIFLIDDFYSPTMITAPTDIDFANKSLPIIQKNGSDKTPSDERVFTLNVEYMGKIYQINLCNNDCLGDALEPENTISVKQIISTVDTINDYARTSAYNRAKQEICSYYQN